MNISRLILDEGIKKYKKEKEINYNLLSRESGISPNTVRKQVLGVTNIQAETFFKLVNILGIMEIEPETGVISFKLTPTRETTAFLSRLKKHL